MWPGICQAPLSIGVFDAVRCWGQEEALKLQTLREVEPFALDKVKGPKGEVANAMTAAIEEHLHEEPYTQAELESLFGETLEQFFGGNASQLRVIHVASTLGNRP